MANKPKQTRVKTHKRGANRNEPAVKMKKVGKNFKQTRDIREDRKTRQTKIGQRK